MNLKGSASYQRKLFQYKGIILDVVLVSPYGWPVNLTRHVPSLIYPNERTTLININSSFASSTLLLVVVMSAISNFEAREAIRESWARDTEELHDVKVVFLVGILESDEVNSNLKTEAEKYGDIIQVHYMYISTANPLNLYLFSGILH